MKKVLITIVGIFLLTSFLSVHTFADAPMGITINDTEVTVDETADMDIVISDNPGFTYLKLGLTYDSDKLEVTVSNGSIIDSLTQERFLVWSCNENADKDGVLCTLHVKVKSDIEIGQYHIELKCFECSNYDEQDVPVELTDGYITIVKRCSTIKCAQLSLGTDISVNYYADVIAADKGAQMRFTMNGKETLVDGTFDEAYGLYVFPFTGITPQCMGDTIKAELVKDGEVLDVKDDYSVLQNCKNLLGKTAKDLGLTDDQYAAMKTLIADLMEYGAAAQVYRGYKADSLMNTDETIAALTPTTFTPWEGEDAEFMAAELSESTDTDTYISAAGVYFDYTNSLYIKFVRPGLTKSNFSVIFGVIDNEGEVVDKVTYTLGDEDHPIVALENGEYLVVFDPVPAYELSYSYEMEDVMWYDITINKVEIVSKKKKTTQIQDLIYSIPTYVCSKQDETTPMAELAKALYTYGLSAANYMTAVEK